MHDENRDTTAEVRAPPLHPVPPGGDRSAPAFSSPRCKTLAVANQQTAVGAANLNVPQRTEEHATTASQLSASQANEDAEASARHVPECFFMGAAKIPPAATLAICAVVEHVSGGVLLQAFQQDTVDLQLVPLTPIVLQAFGIENCRMAPKTAWDQVIGCLMYEAGNVLRFVMPHPDEIRTGLEDHSTASILTDTDNGTDADASTDEGSQQEEPQLATAAVECVGLLDLAAQQQQQHGSGDGLPAPHSRHHRDTAHLDAEFLTARLAHESTEQLHQGPTIIQGRSMRVTVFEALYADNARRFLILQAVDLTTLKEHFFGISPEDTNRIASAAGVTPSSDIVVRTANATATEDDNDPAESARKAKFSNAVLNTLEYVESSDEVGVSFVLERRRRASNIRHARRMTRSLIHIPSLTSGRRESRTDSAAESAALEADMVQASKNFAKMRSKILWEKVRKAFRRRARIIMGFRKAGRQETEQVAQQLTGQRRRQSLVEVRQRVAAGVDAQQAEEQEPRQAARPIILPGHAKLAMTLAKPMLARTERDLTTILDELHHSQDVWLDMIRDLDDAQIPELLRCIRCDHAEPLMPIYEEGSETDVVFWLLSGEVDLGRRNETGVLKSLGRVARGQRFGYRTRAIKANSDVSGQSAQQQGVAGLERAESASTSTMSTSTSSSSFASASSASTSSSDDSASASVGERGTTVTSEDFHSRVADASVGLALPDIHFFGVHADTASAVVRCELLYVHVMDYQRLFGASHRRHVKDCVLMLLNSGLFNAVSREKILELAVVTRFRRINAHQSVYTEGDRRSCVYLIRRGECRTLKWVPPRKDVLRAMHVARRRDQLAGRLSLSPAVLATTGGTSSAPDSPYSAGERRDSLTSLGSGKSGSRFSTGAASSLAGEEDEDAASWENWSLGTVGSHSARFRQETGSDPVRMTVAWQLADREKKLLNNGVVRFVESQKHLLRGDMFGIDASPIDDSHRNDDYGVHRLSVVTNTPVECFEVPLFELRRIALDGLKQLCSLSLLQDQYLVQRPNALRHAFLRKHVWSKVQTKTAKEPRYVQDVPDLLPSTTSSSECSNAIVCPTLGDDREREVRWRQRKERNRKRAEWRRAHDAERRQEVERGTLATTVASVREAGGIGVNAAHFAHGRRQSTMSSAPPTSVPLPARHRPRTTARRIVAPAGGNVPPPAPASKDDNKPGASAGVASSAAAEISGRRKSLSARLALESAATTAFAASVGANDST